MSIWEMPKVIRGEVTYRAQNAVGIVYRKEAAGHAQSVAGVSALSQAMNTQGYAGSHPAFLVRQLVEALKSVGQPIQTADSLRDEQHLGYLVRVVFLTVKSTRHLSVSLTEEALELSGTKYIQEMYDEILARIQKEFDREHWEEQTSKAGVTIPPSPGVESAQEEMERGYQLFRREKRRAELEAQKRDMQTHPTLQPAVDYAKGLKLVREYAYISGRKEEAMQDVSLLAAG